MNHDALKQLVAHCLAAMKAGSRVAAAATAEIQNDARHPNLKAALEAGNQVSQQYVQRLAQALGEAGGSGERQNPVLDGLYEVSSRSGSRRRTPPRATLALSPTASARCTTGLRRLA